MSWISMRQFPCHTHPKIAKKEDRRRAVLQFQLLHQCSYYSRDIAWRTCHDTFVCECLACLRYFFFPQVQQPVCTVDLNWSLFQEWNLHFPKTWRICWILITTQLILKLRVTLRCKHANWKELSCFNSEFPPRHEDKTDSQTGSSWPPLTSQRSFPGHCFFRHSDRPRPQFVAGPNHLTTQCGWRRLAGDLRWELEPPFQLRSQTQSCCHTPKPPPRWRWRATRWHRSAQLSPSVMKLVMTANINQKLGRKLKCRWEKPRTKKYEQAHYACRIDVQRRCMDATHARAVVPLFTTRQSTRHTHDHMMSSASFLIRSIVLAHLTRVWKRGKHEAQHRQHACIFFCFSWK